MKDGFYTALGTPMDDIGELVESSFEKHIRMQINAKAAGLLCMGSMGNMVSVREREYVRVAKVCSETVKKRVPLLVGVMDNSIGRVLDRIDALRWLEIDGVVTTIPYYYKLNDKQIYNFYSTIADKSFYPVYIYDLPSVTQVGISENVLFSLSVHPNIKGIKTANINLLSKIKRNGMLKDFDCLYSGLDTFDVALRSGIRKNLDGMFAVTPKNTKTMYENMDDPEIVSQCLGRILKLRDKFLHYTVFTAFSYAMELLNLDGIYYSDYESELSDTDKRGILNTMKEIGEI